MNKKEKLIAFCLTASMMLMIVSALLTLITNKPADHSFNIEKIFYSKGIYFSAIK